VTIAYPSTAAGRDRYVVERRGRRETHDPFQHQGCLVEQEPSGDGTLVDVATLFLTGRECPWRCLMCDLWRHTIEGDTPTGAIPAQISQAVDELRQRPVFPAHIKLYNASSFFDPRAVPPADYARIADALTPFQHVIVESHPSLVGARVDAFRQLLPGTTLEVAMGLETAHPDALERLNKRMTVGDFQRAAAALTTRGIGVRVFLLVHPPFIAAHEQAAWLARSVDVAFDCGASAVSLIPTRAGNGALDALTGTMAHREPALDDLEQALGTALSQGRGRVFADLWDIARFTHCTVCATARHRRLLHMNLTQRVAPPVRCDRCGGTP
jgi:radical SAM enzyme (TIGR01210 family)